MNQEELIDQYLENNLIEADLATFNELLNSDANFAKEVDFHKKLKAATHLNQRAALKNKLQQLEQPKSKLVKMPNKSIWFAAAVFVLIIAGTIWILFQKPDAQELYAVYYQPYPNVVAPVTRSNNTQDSATQYAFVLYESGNYNDAALVFEKIYTSSKIDFALLYWGICNLQMEKTNNAITLLKEAASNSNDYTVIAKWYLAMAYLKNDEPLLALPLVQEVANANHTLQLIADKLYQKLKAYQ